MAASLFAEDTHPPVSEFSPPFRTMLGYDAEGTPLLSILGKAIYPIQTGKSTNAVHGSWILLQPNDLCAWKPASQVIVSGEACAPNDVAVRELLVEVRLADRTHRVLALGERRMRVSNGSLRFEDPNPFVRIPLGLPFAFGGASQGRSFPPNHVGVGFQLRTPMHALQGKPLPRLEDPENPLLPEHMGMLGFDDWDKLPLPWHCGYVPADFFPRRHWYKHSRPHPQWFMSAHQGLCFSRGLSPGESIMVRNCHPRQPTLLFQLPTRPPRIWAQLDTVAHVGQMQIQDVQIEPSELRFSVVWRVCFRLERDNDMLDARSLQYGILPGADA